MKTGQMANFSQQRADLTDTIAQIRGVRFPRAQDGYEAEAVHAFLEDVARWAEQSIEAAPAAPAPQRESARLSAAAAAILSEAENAAAGIREDAEREATSLLNRSKERAEHARTEADKYSQSVRSAAVTEAENARADAEREAERIRSEADRMATEIVTRAKAEGRELYGEAARHQKSLEAAVRDLTERRAELFAQADSLARKMAEVVEKHSGQPEARPIDSPF